MEVVFVFVAISRMAATDQSLQSSAIQCNVAGLMAEDAFILNIVRVALNRHDEIPKLELSSTSHSRSRKSSKYILARLAQSRADPL